MKLNELVEQYGDYDVKDGFMDFLEKHKQKTVWDLQVGDEFIILYSDGSVDEFTWENSQMDEDVRNQGNLFLTREDEEYESKCREIKTIVSKYARPFIVEENNWYALYTHRAQTISFSCSHTLQEDILYFDSKEKIEQAINEVGEHDFIKYFLKVRDYDIKND